MLFVICGILRSCRLAAGLESFYPAFSPFWETHQQFGNSKNIKNFNSLVKHFISQKKQRGTDSVGRRTRCHILSNPTTISKFLSPGEFAQHSTLSAIIENV
ncbi:hypothetical protein Pst134EA_025469 [Puccinia striiformis f. sp. tritici]|uniref:hypothetical protein n=1 Tax=Puccinia striiformis f. sp. tritici TaxID=168172 RepID=UPI00200738E9|nr:hypothetical protein Pst134EA_025469 [Puccinia striiformis f. sp. tritici]KAH9451519.1 hypothetical protein Pst134EA_025469 [Puccinia striiformis f. sp. tritici]